MIVFKVLIVVFVVIIWKLTYPKVAMWLEEKTSVDFEEEYKTKAREIAKKKRRDVK